MQTREDVQWPNDPELATLLPLEALRFPGGPRVARSSTEAEYHAMAVTVNKVLWLWWLLRDMGVIYHNPTPLFCDNQAALHITQNPIYHEWTKHVKMDCYFVREHVQSREILPWKIAMSSQMADLFTKVLGLDHFHSLVFKLRVCDLHSPTWRGSVREVTCSSSLMTRVLNRIINLIRK